MSELLKVFKEKRKNVYSVEKILDKRKIKGVTKYLIKWKGYSETDSTWEPLHHLTFIREMVDEFEEGEGKREEGWRRVERGRKDDAGRNDKEKRREKELGKDERGRRVEGCRKEGKEVREMDEDLKRREEKIKRRKEEERKRKERESKEERGKKKERSKRRGFKEKRVGIIYDAFDGKSENAGNILFLLLSLFFYLFV